MKLPIVGTLAAGLLFAATPTFAQTPTGHTNVNKTEDKAEHKAQWKECMQRMESKDKGHEKSEAPHKGDGKAAAIGKVADSKTTAKPEPQGEGKKMNRHEEEMQACRDQLYGGKHEEGGKEGKASDDAR